MTQLSSGPQPDTLEGPPYEEVGVGYWEIPSSIDKAAFEHETPEDEDAADEFVLQAFWETHARVHNASSRGVDAGREQPVEGRGGASE